MKQAAVFIIWRGIMNCLTSNRKLRKLQVLLITFSVALSFLAGSVLVSEPVKADELYESFESLDEVKEYKGDHFEIRVCGASDSDFVRFGMDSIAYINSINGEIITSIELTRGSKSYGVPSIAGAVCSQDGDVFTFTGLNTPSVVLEADKKCAISKIVIYYERNASSDFESLVTHSNLSEYRGSSFSVSCVPLPDADLDPRFEPDLYGNFEYELGFVVTTGMYEATISSLNHEEIKSLVFILGNYYERAPITHGLPLIEGATSVRYGNVVVFSDLNSESVTVTGSGWCPIRCVIAYFDDTVIDFSPIRRPAPGAGQSYTPEQLRFMSAQNFVENLYLNVLGRPFDTAGRDYWTDQLVNRGVSGADVVTAFMGSPEFSGIDASNEEFVRILYKVFLNREGSAGEVAGWVNALDNNASRTQVIHEFAASEEWTHICAYYCINL